jgi:anthranilate/para-aminobenzoate synthase component I
VDELTASYSEPMSTEDLTDIQEENNMPHEAEDDDCRSPPIKTLTVKETKAAFDHLEQFLSIMEECDTNAERSSQVCRAVDRDTASYRLLYQEKEKASVQHSIDQFFMTGGKMPSASTSSHH